MASKREAGSRSGNKGGVRGRASAANVVTPSKPWGLIAAAVVVVVFAAGVVTYALVQVDRAEADQVTSAEQIEGVAAYEYDAGRHTYDAVAYDQSPPVGGLHDYSWADCTGTVYEVDIRHENAVHSLEHGAVWITYNPDRLSAQDVTSLADRVEGRSGLMLSPYAGLDGVISLQSWNHQLFLDSATDPRIDQYIDFFLFNPEHTPEPGASCENPAFLADPPVAGSASSSTDAEMP